MDKPSLLVHVLLCLFLAAVQAADVILSRVFNTGLGEIAASSENGSYDLSLARVTIHRNTVYVWTDEPDLIILHARAGNSFNLATGRPASFTFTQHALSEGDGENDRDVEFDVKPWDQIMFVRGKDDAVSMTEFKAIVTEDLQHKICEESDPDYPDSILLRAD